MTQIPIYRAKEINSKDWIKGYLCEAESGFWIDGEDDDGHIFHREIDPSTLSIHFPDMIDKNKKRIFASLSEDGVGGDTLFLADIGELIVLFSKELNATIGKTLVGDIVILTTETLNSFEVIGIHTKDNQ